ncbi:MAG: GNAT family N-acetyltransferase [Defluviitaleaceae bacterium]|nr:GNAT family N-acetyltransferase [Defluviitaleaceae bacterium]
MIATKFTEFEFERLIFRKFREADFPIVYSWHSDAETMQYRRDGVKTEAETREFLNNAIAAANADPCEDFWFAVVCEEVLIGEGILFNDRNEPELGWLVDKNHWGQGYGTKIGSALLKFAFDTLNLHRVIACCNVDNHASYRMMEKIGMRREGHHLKAKLVGGVWCDRFQYAILREEYNRV